MEEGENGHGALVEICRFIGKESMSWARKMYKVRHAGWGIVILLLSDSIWASPAGLLPLQHSISLISPLYLSPSPATGFQRHHYNDVNRQCSFMSQLSMPDDSIWECRAVVRTLLRQGK
jgi:hypothetical protein